MPHTDVCSELTCWLLDRSNDFSSSLMWWPTSFKRSLSRFPITWTFSLASKQSVPSAFTNSWQDMSCSEATLSWDSNSSRLICYAYNKTWFTKNMWSLEKVQGDITLTEWAIIPEDQNAVLAQGRLHSPWHLGGRGLCFNPASDRTHSTRCLNLFDLSFLIW